MPELPEVETIKRDLREHGVVGSRIEHAEVLDRALARVEEPERTSESGPGGFTGAPDMSHEARPEEREGG